MTATDGREILRALGLADRARAVGRHQDVGVAEFVEHLDREETYWLRRLDNYRKTIDEVKALRGRERRVAMNTFGMEYRHRTVIEAAQDAIGRAERELERIEIARSVVAGFVDSLIDDGLAERYAHRAILGLDKEEKR